MFSLLVVFFSLVSPSTPLVRLKSKATMEPPKASSNICKTNSGWKSPKCCNYRRWISGINLRMLALDIGMKCFFFFHIQKVHSLAIIMMGSPKQFRILHSFLDFLWLLRSGILYGSSELDLIIYFDKGYSQVIPHIYRFFSIAPVVL